MKDITDAIKGGYIGGNVIGKKYIENQLKKAAMDLKNLIEKYMRDYFTTHRSAEYIRTHNLEKSVDISNTVIVEPTLQGANFCIYVYFNEKALHRSGFGVWGDSSKNYGKYQEGSYGFGDDVMNTAIAVDQGYTVQSPVWFKDIPRFGKRKGAKFVEKAIDDFNSQNKYGIFIDKVNDVIII